MFMKIFSDFVIVNVERHFEDYLYCLTTSWRYFTYKLWREGGRVETVDTDRYTAVWVWGLGGNKENTQNIPVISDLNLMTSAAPTPDVLLHLIDWPVFVNEKSLRSSSSPSSSR